MKIKTTLYSISSLFLFNSCTDYSYVDILACGPDDGLNNYIVIFEDEHGHQQTEHVFDWELTSNNTIKVYTFSDKPGYLDSHYINKPFEIIENF